MKSPPAGQDDGGDWQRAEPPSSGGAQHGKCLFFFVGQRNRGVEVVGVWDKVGAMLRLPGPKMWTKHWLRSGAHLTAGVKVDDVRVQSVDGLSRWVYLTLLDVGAQLPEGGSAVEGGHASHASHVPRSQVISCEERCVLGGLDVTAMFWDSLFF